MTALAAAEAGENSICPPLMKKCGVAEGMPAITAHWPLLVTGRTKTLPAVLTGPPGVSRWKSSGRVSGEAAAACDFSSFCQSARRAISSPASCANATIVWAFGSSEP